MACCSDNPANAGELRHTITIESNEETRTALGGIDTVWQPFATIQAKMTFKSGNEMQKRGRLEAFRGYQFVFRYIDNMRESYRIVYNGRRFNIKSVENHQERNRWLIVMATENTED